MTKTFLTFMSNYISLFHQKYYTTQFEILWHLKVSVSLSGPFKLVLARLIYSPQVPRHDMISEIIWLGGCFIEPTTQILTRCLPNTRQMSNGDDVWQSAVCFSSSLVSGWLLNRPVRLQSKFFAGVSQKSASTDCCII